MGTPRSTVFARSLVFAGTAALAACNSGSSLGVPAQSSPATQSLTHSVQPAKEALAPNPYPTGTGDVFNYNYLLVLSNSPGTTSQLYGTVVTTIGSSTTFNGNPVVDYNSVLNYNSRVGERVVGTTTTDDYDNFVGSGSPSYLYYYGHKQSGNETDNGTVNVLSSNTQTYGAPFILDILPEAKTNKATEPGAYTLTASNSSTGNGGSSSSETYSRNNDGSSTTSESITLGGNTYSYSNTINSNFSASEANGVPGQPTSGSTTFSAPSGNVVTVVYTPTVGSPVTNEVPVWWGSNPLLSDQFKTVSVTEKVPAKCASGYTGDTSTHLREILSYVDPVGGSTDSETIDRWVVSGVGVACLANTRLVTYYDNRDTGSEIGSTSISVLQGLQSETLSQRNREIVGFGPVGGSHAILPSTLKVNRSLLGH
jgi:hypothetical protein